DGDPAGDRRNPDEVRPGGRVRMRTPGRRRGLPEHRQFWPSALQTAVLWGLALAFLLPLAWFVLSSFKPASELFRFPLTPLPERWSVEGYATAWERYDFARYFLNTTVV